MHHSETAQTLAMRQADEFGQCQTGLIAAQAMQIALALKLPIALAQFVDHITANARAAETQGIVGVKQRAGIKLITQAIAQDRLVVFLPLVGNGGGHRALPGAGRALGQPFDSTHCARKQVDFSLTLTRCCRLGLSSGLSQGVRLGQLFLDLLEVL
jgi:hypothetical protein